MRKIVILPVLITVLALCGCATTQNGNSTANAIASINAIVPLAVAVEVQREPKSVPYFVAAADVTAMLASGTNYSATQLAADIHAINVGGNNQYAEIAVLTGVAIYQIFFAQQVVPNGSDSQAVLFALSSAIRQGLPPADIPKLKAIRAKNIAR